MLKKFIIILFAFFLLSGNFSGFSFFSYLPLDISLFVLILPIIYCIFHFIINLKFHKTHLILFIFLIFSSVFFLFNEHNLEKVILFYGIFSVLFFVTPYILNDERAIKIFIYSLLGSSILITFLTLIGFGDLNVNGRLTFNNGNPIWLGRAVAVSILISIVLLKVKKMKIVTFLTIFISSSYVLIMTGSKGPIIALLIALIIIYFDDIKAVVIRKALSKKVFLSMYITIFFVVCTLIFLKDQFLGRLLNLSADESTSSRLELYTQSFKIIFSEPFGIGIGKFQEYTNSPYDYPHNLILESFIELGWLNALIFLIIIFLGIMGLVNMSKENFYYSIILGVVIMSFVNAMVSGNLTSPKDLYMFLPIGLTYYIKSLKPGISSSTVNEKKMVLYD